MRITNNANIQQPAALNVYDQSKPGAGSQSDLITNTSTVNGTWGAITALAATVIATLVTTSVKTLNGAVTGIAASSAVLGVTYTIQTLGTTTPAQFNTLFGVNPNGAVWAVGMTAQAVGAGAGTAVLSTDEQSITALTVPVGVTIYGEFKQITLTSGSVIAYRG